MNIKSRVRQIWKWIGLIWVVGFFAFMVYDFAINGPKAQVVQSQLENEFKSIEPMPSARACDYKATHKTSQALVTCGYSTNLSYADMRAHYDIELARHGWVFYEEDEMRDWGRDFGGKTARYCKGGYRANLQYAGQDAGYGWDYAFSVSWGLDSLVDKYSDKFRKVGCR
ncbi:MAG: hypothetical protein LC754_19615 [Acidobacteria bacterium]|nr:hypothetical protein [Acidobacteriota bacterium]